MKICLDSVSGDPSLLRMSITRWKLQLTTSCYKYGPLICQTRRASYYSSICALALMFGVTIQTEVSRDAPPALDHLPPSKCGSNETSIYKPESSGDASKSRFSVCPFGEGGPSMFEGTTLIASLGIFMGPHWFIYTRNTDVGHHANPSITINSGWFMTNLITSNLVLAVDTSNGQWRRWKIMQRSWYSIKWWVISILR